MSVSGSQFNCHYMDCVCRVAAVWQIMFSACPVSSAKWEIKITRYENYSYSWKWYVLGRMADVGMVRSHVLTSFRLRIRFRELRYSYRSGLSSQEWVCNCPCSLKPLSPDTNTLCLPQKLSIMEYAPAWEFLLYLLLNLQRPKPLPLVPTILILPKPFLLVISSSLGSKNPFFFSRAIRIRQLGRRRRKKGGRRNKIKKCISMEKEKRVQ